MLFSPKVGPHWAVTAGDKLCLKVAEQVQNQAFIFLVLLNSESLYLKKNLCHVVQ